MHHHKLQFGTASDLPKYEYQVNLSYEIRKLANLETHFGFIPLKRCI